MDWPPVNIIEAVWDHLDKEQKKQAANIQSRAVNFIQKAQSTVLDDALKKLQESLPERVPVVLKYKGGHTRYWLSRPLESDKLWFCQLYCISIFLCA